MSAMWIGKVTWEFPIHVADRLPSLSYMETEVLRKRAFILQQMVKSLGILKIPSAQWYVFFTAVFCIFLHLLVKFPLCQ